MALDHKLTQNAQTRLDSPLDPNPTPIEVKGLVWEYLLTARAEGKSPLSIENYSQKLRDFLSFVIQNGATTQKQITPNLIRLFLISLQDKNLKPSYIDSYHRSIKTFFNWMVREHYLQYSPMVNIKHPKLPKRVIRPFTQDDIKNLLTLCSGDSYIDVRNRAMVLIFLDTALRLHELTRIQLHDVSPDLETIKVMGKGAKERRVRIGRLSQKALIKYLRRRQGFNNTGTDLWLTEEGRCVTGGWYPW